MNRTKLQYIRCGRDRLLKLAKRLFRRKLGVGKFNFAVFYSTNCTSSGCALGECPSLFPKYWRYSKNFRRTGDDMKSYDVILKSTGKGNFIGATKFFGISRYEADNLFAPDSQCEFGDETTRELPDWATAKEVAENIRLFVKLKDKEIRVSKSR